ncbi:c-type cytochrome [Aestuariispira ectoiniformans]|uniref:c-type cytochrome n=1 Tax=Aestuariispira ectoiniformans TaxID=2775080 RepID=UPI00223AFC0C|nr:cytochrome C4 [Aestuariispira ectoiniformans]
MTSKTLAATILAASLAMASAAYADDSKSTVPAKAHQCFSCHSATGKPLLADVPIIAGQQPLYLYNALQHYKTGNRNGGQALVMKEIIKDLSNEDLKTLADWFGEQK